MTRKAAVEKIIKTAVEKIIMGDCIEYRSGRTRVQVFKDRCVPIGAVLMAADHWKYHEYTSVPYPLPPSYFASQPDRDPLTDLKHVLTGKKAFKEALKHDPE
jgi:hypothetical protein